jgi:two-component system, cell cycle response regulator
LIHQRFEELKLSGNLPTSSGVGLAVLRLTQHEAVSVEELLWCIQADPALTGRIVSLARAAREDGEAPCLGVIQAAKLIGMRQVRRASLEFTLVSSHRAGVCAPFDYDHFWSSALCTAVAARHLAGRLRAMDPEEAFMLGLVSRIGMLALATVHPDTYATILEGATQYAEVGLCHAEANAIGIDHREVTAAMLAEWGMPDAHSGAILALASREDDFTEEGGEEDPLAALIALAQSISQVLSIPESGVPGGRDRAWSKLVARARSSGLDSDELVHSCGVVARQWREWCELVRLPMGEAHGLTEVLSSEPTFTPIGEVSEDPCRTGAGSTSSVARRMEPARVLVVDDDEKLARLVAYHLTKAGYTVITATNGHEALRLSLTEHPQIVISDWMMPEMNGLELCGALRKTEGGRKTYVLILTAREDEDRIVDAFQAGADDYVTKPFKPRILLARVQAAQRLVDLQRQVDDDKRIREQQVAELGLLTRKLRAAALTDVLTGLPNRRCALSRLQEEWDSAEPAVRPMSVIMVDIDNFKAINDNHGHDVGDYVLKATAHVLREFARRGDTVCRLGGEEFLVLNVNSDASGAAMCAERLRAAVEANHIDYETFHGRVTVSLGVAERTESMRDVDALLKAADMANYAAKAAGRNCLRLAESEQQTKRSA